MDGDGHDGAVSSLRIMAVAAQNGYGGNVTVRGLEVKIRAVQGHVELARLTTTLNQVRLALGEIDHAYVLRGSRPRWVVDSLRDGPGFLLVRVTAVSSARRQLGSVLAPVEALVSGVESLTSIPEVPQYYSDKTVERVIKIGEPGQGVQEISLAAVNGSSNYVPLSEGVLQNAQRAIRAATTSLGSVGGWLDQISARRAARGVITVGLYDPLTKRAVTGSLPMWMEDEAKGYWRHRVLAVGQVTRNERGQVVRISIERFEPLPESDEARAPVRELLGIDPDWLGGQSVDEYIREARRA